MRIKKILLISAIGVCILTGCEKGDRGIKTTPVSSVTNNKTSNDIDKAIKSTNYFKNKTVQDFINMGNIITRATNYNLDDVYFTAESEDGQNIYSFVLEGYMTDDDVDIYTSTEDNEEDYSEFMEYKLDDVKVLDLNKFDIKKYKGKQFSELLNNNFSVTYVFNTKDKDTVTKQGVMVTLDRFNLNYFISFKDKEATKVIKGYTNDISLKDVQKNLSDSVIKKIEEED